MKVDCFLFTFLLLFHKSLSWCVYQKPQAPYPFGCYYAGAHIPNGETMFLGCLSCSCRHNGLLRCCPTDEFYNNHAKCAQSRERGQRRRKLNPLKTLNNYRRKIELKQILREI